MYTTFLLDLDGVLIDSATLIDESFKAVLGSHNIQDKPERAALLMGKSLLKHYRFLVGDDNPEKLCEEHLIFQNANLHLAPAYPDVLDTLAKLKEKNCKLAVITNRSGNAKELLKTAGVLPFLDLVITYEDVQVPKPDPEGILKAMKALEADPSKTVMVGDTYVDVEAGKAAGITTIGIDRDVCSEELMLARPNFVVRQFVDILPFA